MRYIQVTRDLEAVLERLGVEIFEEWKHEGIEGVEQSQQWLVNKVKKILMAGKLETAFVRYRGMAPGEKVSGKMGDLSYVHPKDGVPYARRLPSKSVKSTPGQRKQLGRMMPAIIAWRKLDKSQKLYWIKIGKKNHVHGMFLFRGIYMSLEVDKKSIPTPLLPTAKILKYYRKRKARNQLNLQVK